jgi:hypothetical protein
MICAMRFALLVLLALPILQNPETTLLILDEAYPEKQTAVLAARSWLGFFLDDKGAGRLAPVTVVMGPRSIGCSDEQFVVNITGDPSGALYALSSSALRPGSVISVRQSYPVSMSIPRENSEVALVLGQRQYTLRRDGPKEDGADARMTLSDGRATQVLFPVSDFVDDPHFTLHWAGDMDGDGRLDLITTFSEKYSVFPTRLWLSSAARDQQLVGVAASLQRNSC